MVAIVVPGVWSGVECWIALAIKITGLWFVINKIARGLHAPFDQLLFNRHIYGYYVYSLVANVFALRSSVS